MTASTKEPVGLMPQRLVARSIRFQQHPTLCACWVWTGSVDPNGHGRVCLGGRNLSARQAVYARYRGAAGGHLKPTCGVELCVNPSHLKDCS